MRTDKQLYKLLAAGPELFRLLTGIELKGEYRLQSVTFKEFSRTADAVCVPLDAAEPVFVLEVQARKDAELLDRLVMEVVLARKEYKERPVFGLALFFDSGSEDTESPWRECLGHGPLLPPVYLDKMLDALRMENPRHPLLAVFLPLMGTDEELKRGASAAWRQMNLPGNEETLRIFMSWMLERCKSNKYKEIMDMFHELVPLEETCAYKELVAIGMEKGMLKGKLEGYDEEARAILKRQISRRFKSIPDWVPTRLSNAKAPQIERWAENIFDAKTVEDLFNSES